MNNHLFDMDPVTVAPTMNPELSPSCRAGERAEAAFLAEAIKRNIGVFIPFGHATKSDFMCHTAAGLKFGVQVKKAVSESRDSYCRHKITWVAGKPGIMKSKLKAEGKVGYTRYQRGDFDILAAYMESRGSFAFYLFDETTGKTGTSWVAGTGMRENNWEVFGPGVKEID